MINLHELILKTKNIRQRLQQHIHLEELTFKKTKNTNMFMHIKRNNLLLHRPKHEWIDIKHINHKEKKGYQTGTQKKACLIEY